MRNKMNGLVFLFTCLIALSLLVAQAARAEEDETPPAIPLFIAVSHEGELSVTSGLLDAPTLSVRLSITLSDRALKMMTNKILVVRLVDLTRTGRDTIFDLKEHPINQIQFDRGYYQASRLTYLGDNTLLLELHRTLYMNQQPMQALVNRTKIQTKNGRISCFETAFRRMGMVGAVVNSVRLRLLPFVPMEVDENWIGSLYKNEQVIVHGRFCNAGMWLRVERASGRIGWAKEWGLSEELNERTFIAPAEPTPTPTARP